MRTHAFILRHCRNPFAGPAVRALALPPAAHTEGCQMQAVAPLTPYRALRRWLRQQWEVRMRRPPEVQDHAAAAQVADPAMATMQLHLECMLDLVADASYADLPPPQRQRIQAEINQHVAAVDHLARTTAIAGVRLLDGSGRWPGAVPAHWAVAPAVCGPQALPPDLRAQTLALHCVSAATAASAREGQLQLQHARAQVAQTRARIATAQLMARLAAAPQGAEEGKAPHAPSRAVRPPLGAAVARAVTQPLRAARPWWSWWRHTLQRWLARGRGDDAAR